MHHFSSSFSLSLSGAVNESRDLLSLTHTLTINRAYLLYTLCYAIRMLVITPKDLLLLLKVMMMVVVVLVRFSAR